jgi:tRNA U38,U39,U40 pseudouridine synthase TruA
MVGALVKCALGKMHVEDISVRLKSSEPSSARFSAPAEGLFLVRVRY